MSQHPVVGGGGRREEGRFGPECDLAAPASQSRPSVPAPSSSIGPRGGGPYTGTHGARGSRHLLKAVAEPGPQCQLVWITIVTGPGRSGLTPGQPLQEVRAGVPLGS